MSSQALFTTTMPASSAVASRAGISAKQSTGARAAVGNVGARKFGAVPQRSSTVAMAHSQGPSGLNIKSSSQGSQALTQLGQKFSNTFESVSSQFNQMLNPQQPYMQLATGAGSVPLYDNSVFAMQSNSQLPGAARAPSALQSQVDSRRATVSNPRAGLTTMRASASPVVMGAASTEGNMDHFDKAMVASMGINGFGRIGRLVFRSTFMEQADKAKVVAINAPGKDLSYLKYLLEFDSVHGRFPGTVEIGDGGLIVNGEFVKVFGERDPANIKWDTCSVDYVCESTGVFLTQESIQGHLDGGAKKVVFAAPAKDDSPTFVFGVNHETYDSSMTVVSNASCTTNCLAPMSKVINDKFGIEEGLMTTVHATTASNVTVDGASAKDWRGGRANGPNIIPSSTGAAKAVGKVLPELKGLLTGMAFRVPTTNVSVVDLTVKLKNEATWDDICDAMKEAQDGPMKGVVEFVDTPLVSQDFVSHAPTCCFDSNASIQLSPKFVKLVAWYDNEWAYSNQLVKLTHYMADQDGALLERAMVGE